MIAVLTQRLRLRLILVAVLSILAGCASQQAGGPYSIDETMKSRGQNSRVDIIVLHYTASTKPSALMTLTIGIEIVHPGWQPNAKGENGQPYPDAQIAVVAALTSDIAKRHGILPENIVGHSDVAPGRKVDPGPSFPWKKLAQLGVGRWFDEALAAKYQAEFVRKGPPDAGWFQQQLKRVGYAVPENGYFDQKTLAVIAAFQAHYRPALVTGKPDAETAARLQALPTSGSGL